MTLVTVAREDAGSNDLGFCDFWQHGAGGRPVWVIWERVLSLLLWGGGGDRHITAALPEATKRSG